MKRHEKADLIGDILDDLYRTGGDGGARAGSRLGHKTATMTLDQYGHLFPDDLDDVTDKMDDLVSECAPKCVHDGRLYR